MHGFSLLGITRPDDTAAAVMSKTVALFGGIGKSVMGGLGVDQNAGLVMGVVSVRVQLTVSNRSPSGPRPLMSSGQSSGAKLSSCRAT